MEARNLPDILLLDLNMPEMGGFETSVYLRNKFPSIKILMLTMYDTDQVLIRLLQHGVSGFLKKDTHPAELNFAIQSVIKSGFYYSEQFTRRMANLFLYDEENIMALERNLLNRQELCFLKLVCTDLTYKEVAIKMKLNPRAVDNLRDNLFIRLEVKSRVGLVMYAMRQGIVAF